MEDDNLLTQWINHNCSNYEVTVAHSCNMTKFFLFLFEYKVLQTQ